MTKMKYYLSFLTAALLISASSCKKEFLDLKPYDQISSDIAITNEAGMQNALNGVYAKFRDVDLFGRSITLNGDLIADNVYIAATNSNRYLTEFTYAFLNTYGNGLTTWTDAYNAILRANNVINAPLPSSANVNQMKGEALTLRAIMYFYLVNYWGKQYTIDQNAPGVPLILEYDPALKPARKKVGEIYQQIDKDLADAVTMLTATKNSSYVTKFVARSMQAKVAMFKGDWVNAKAIALDVVNNGGYTLTTPANYVNYWKAATPVTSKVETIFEISNDLVNNGGTDALSYFYDLAGYGDAMAADDLYNLYTATDVRRSLMIPGVKSGQAVKLVIKYPNTSSTSDRDEIKILRYSDVLLILAEAYARTSDEPNALIRVNEVAQQRDPSFAGYSSTGTALINDIILERRKELAFEGHRYLDLQRLNIDVVRVNVAGNYPSNTPLSLPVSSHKRLFPIPIVEMDANTNIAQNPLY
jgi:starch-binding outer membrane protein, SusD/RagB family